MIVVDHESRINIDQVLDDEFFNEVRELTSFPELTETEQSLKEVCDDFIKRGNVYKLEG